MLEMPQYRAFLALEKGILLAVYTRRKKILRAFESSQAPEFRSSPFLVRPV